MKFKMQGSKPRPGAKAAAHRQAKADARNRREGYWMLCALASCWPRVGGTKAWRTPAAS